MWIRCALVTWLVCLAASSARAWPTPAAGASASGDPELILTFDDGPSPGPTDAVLETLAKHRVKAVFFVVGWRLERGGPKVTAVVDKMVKAGHVIANHTMSHAHMCTIKPERAEWEIDAANLAITRAVAMDISWFRTPYGSYCKRMEEMLAARGRDHFHWDIDPQEWKSGSASHATAYVTSKLRKLEGRAVLLLHDTRSVTTRALPAILDWIAVENQQRIASGRRPIRIVDAPAYAAELLSPELRVAPTSLALARDWLSDQLARCLP